MIAQPSPSFHLNYVYFYSVYRRKQFDPLLSAFKIIPLFKPSGVSGKAAHTLYKCEVTRVKRSGWKLMRNVIPEKPSVLYKLRQLRLIEHSSGPTVKANKQAPSSA